MPVHLGAHISIAGGLSWALTRGRELGCDTIQLFVKNARQWDVPPLESQEIKAFKASQRDTAIQPIFVHSSYLINLASPDAELYARSRRALEDELSRAQALGIPYVVLHPGSYRSGSAKQGLSRVAQAVQAILPGFRVRLLLENTAGQGHMLGSDFLQLGAMLERIDLQDKVGICLDTSHAFAAGYDLRGPEPLKQTLKRFDADIGLQRLKLLHLNDSRHPLGSLKDQHTHIGTGYLGEAAFRAILKHPALTALPMIIETPKGQDEQGRDWDQVNLSLLRKLAR